MTILALNHKGIRVGGEAIAPLTAVRATLQSLGRSAVEQCEASDLAGALSMIPFITEGLGCATPERLESEFWRIRIIA